MSSTHKSSTHFLFNNPLIEYFIVVIVTGFCFVCFLKVIKNLVDKYYLAYIWYVMAIWRKDKKCFNFLILLDTLFFKVFFLPLYDYFEGSNLDFVSWIKLSLIWKWRMHYSA